MFRDGCLTYILQWFSCGETLVVVDVYCQSSYFEVDRIALPIWSQAKDMISVVNYTLGIELDYN